MFGMGEDSRFFVGVFVGTVLGMTIRLKSTLTASTNQNHVREDDAEGQDFVTAGSVLLNWIVKYRTEMISSLPVVSRVEPNYLVKALPSHAPVLPESWISIFADLKRLIVPGLTHWESSAKFFAYFKPHASYPAVLGELLCAGLNVMGFDWIASPACTELEMATLDWLARFLHLPDKFLHAAPGPGGSVIQGSAGEAAIVACLAALCEKQRQWVTRGNGAAGNSTSSNSSSSSSVGGVGGGLQESGSELLPRQNMVVFSSDQAHAIVQKACMVLGVGHHHIIPTSGVDGYALQPGALRAALEEEMARGRVPVLIVGTTGTTSTCAFDPVRALGEVAREFGVWLHIDAAYGGAYACLPQLRPLFDGLELADSFVVNCHKKLLCPFDLAAMYVADRTPLLNALSLQPEYLRNAASESGAVVDYEHWQLPLGRRFRALKLWFVFRRYGQKQLQQHLQRGLDLSAYFASLLEETGLFELVAPLSLSLVCFRLAGARPETDQQRLLDAVKSSGDCFIIHTKLEGRIALRLACGGMEQTPADVYGAYQVILREARKIVL